MHLHLTFLKRGCCFTKINTFFTPIRRLLTRHVPAEVYEVCQDKNIFLTNENQEKEGSKAEDLLQA